MAENKDKEGSSGSQKKNWWDNEMVDKLINLYEARPCLWDIADPTYSKRTFLPLLCAVSKVLSDHTFFYPHLK